jgi:hypothetical protein
MEGFLASGMPDASQCAVAEMIAEALDALSTSEEFPVSPWQLSKYLSQNCAEAKGDGSATFFKVTVAKALDQMRQTKMVFIEPNGARLTENGRWSLLGEGRGATGLKKVVGDSGTGAKEPKAVTKIPADSLLMKNDAKLRALGVKTTDPELLMVMRERKWSMDEFLKKAGDFAPTLLLTKMKNGTECGGVAGVPWPKQDDEAGGDPAKGSFIFSLGETPARFDLITPEQALFNGVAYFGFGPNNGGDLTVWSEGNGCGSWGQRAYAGPREMGQLVGGTTAAYYQPYEVWELWRL